MTKRVVSIVILTSLALGACGESSNGGTDTSAAARVKNAARTTVAGAEATRDLRGGGTSTAESDFKAKGGCTEKGAIAYADSKQKKKFFCELPARNATETAERKVDANGNCASNRTKFYRYLDNGTVDLNQPTCAWLNGL